MSMAAKLSNLVDKMSEANLQADGQVEKPAQGVADLWEMEEEDSSPLHSLMWSPVQRLPVRPPQYETLPGNTSDFNR